jgi:TolB-like protein/DNA-binding winged helix-turn-helix (wHTH) protein/Tfp pilus assembly protein PilF
MDVRGNKTYVLGQYSLQPDKRLLCVGDKALRLTPGPFQVLVYLIENRDHVVPRDELLDHFWEGKDTYDESLRKCVGAIRKALNDGAENPRYVETHYGEGYRYIGPFEEQFIQNESLVEIGQIRGVKTASEEVALKEAPHSDEQAGKPAETTRASQTPSHFTRPIKVSGGHRRIAIQAVIFVLLIVGGLLLISSSKRPTREAYPLVPIRSIAVLPLKNLTGDPAEEFFSDGLTETFITELAKIKGLKVISRGSAFAFKGKEVDPREVGRLLGVASVLEGSVGKSDDRVRVEVRLVSSGDGRVLWASDTYDRALKDIFAIQDGIAYSVVAELKVRICNDGERFKRHTNNVEAYQQYLKGRYLINNQYESLSTTGPDTLRKAAQYFEQAIQMDPNYAPAYAGLADANTGLVWFSPEYPEPLIVKAKAAALKAVKIDDGLPEAQTALATVYIHQWDFEAARQAYEQAISLNPDNAWAHDGYATYLMAEGRVDEMLAEISRAEELDPLNVYIIGDRGALLCMARRYDESIAEFLKSDDLHQYNGPNENVAKCQAGKGMYVEAVKEFQRAREATTARSRIPEALTSLAVAYGMAGQKEQTRQLLAEVTLMSRTQYVPKTFLAYIYASLNEKEPAFKTLEAAYREHDSNLIGLKTEPWLDPLRSDPRFADLIRRVGLSP